MVKDGIKIKMVVFLDLEDEGEPPEQLGGEMGMGMNRTHWMMQHHGNVGQDLLRGLSLGTTRAGIGARGKEMELERDNPNKEKSVTEALACYPYVYTCQ